MASKRIRWWIVWALFGSTVINYISRQTFSVLAPVITQELHLSHTDLSRIFSAFQISYAGMWLIGGVLLDVVGTRLGLALAVIWWSAMSMLTGFANSVASFGGIQVSFGNRRGLQLARRQQDRGRMVSRPGARRGRGDLRQWIKCGRRDCFSHRARVAILLGWRYAFVLSGLLGFLWLILWLAIYHPIDQHPRLTAEERALIVGGRDTPTVSAQKGLARWLALLKQPNVWGIVLGLSLTDPIWWFYVFWLPQYLSENGVQPQTDLATSGGVPFVAADIGNFAGGFASGFLIKRGMAVVGARKWVCVISSLPLLAGIPRRPDSQPLCGNLPDQPCRVGVCKLGNHQKECRGVGEFIHKPTHQQGEDNSRQAGTKSAQSGHRTDNVVGEQVRRKSETQSANRVRYLFATSTYWRDMNGRRWHN